MTDSPYVDQPDHAFWRSAVAETSPLDLQSIYKRRWPIEADWKIATAGSCFAQHIARYMKAADYTVMDVEPKPNGLPEADAPRFGYGIFSARYSNIYTARQLLQLVREALGQTHPVNLIWEKDGRYYDSRRPGIEPGGFESAAELLDHRVFQLRHVRQMLEEMDLLIFTLGLTETWEHTASGTVFPTAPGTIAGQFDPNIYSFRNFTFAEVYDDLTTVLDLLKAHRDTPLKVLLSVSPVPLTATAEDHHVLQSSTYSKSVLRAVAGQLRTEREDVDYFPSFEIVTNPAARGVFYAPNLRSVTPAGVACVMRSFFAEHAGCNAAQDPTTPKPVTDEDDGDDVVCEEAMLEAFGK
ncbi:MAG: GSCFA domain-containing protein [Marinibacterium sp.]|nr:GSCFA domain-containing protein [Marinibacterium sp.]